MTFDDWSGVFYILLKNKMNTKKTPSDQFFLVLSLQDNTSRDVWFTVSDQYFQKILYNTLDIRMHFSLNSCGFFPGITGSGPKSLPSSETLFKHWTSEEKGSDRDLPVIHS